MQSENFVEMIGRPDRLDHGSEEKLRLLAEKFPYSQPIRILFAKNLLQMQRPDFEMEVNQAAACATDRRKFQIFISGRTKPIAPTKGIAAAKNKTAKNKKPTFIQALLLILFSKNKKPALATKINKAALEPAAGSSKPQKISEPETPVANIEVTPIKANSKHKALIDRFILEEPRIIPRRENIINENLAAKNQMDPQDIGTETLAVILLKQGQHQKALDIYQKLSLKFPEKSRYFAEKINSIKIEINLKK